jgi:SAM-dependent methyltransferase
MAIVMGLLPPGGRVLDIACGPGRLGLALGDTYDTFGVDLSPAMLAEARSTGHYELTLGDAFALPFANGAFDAAVALRLLFHFPDPRPILSELARVTRPGGRVVFETCGWSPRAGRSLDPARWGPPVYVHRSDQVRGMLAPLGLQPRRRCDAFLFSPLLYRLLPSFGAAFVERLESILPRSCRCRSFWQAEVGEA